MNANVFKTFLEGMAWAEQGADGFGDLQSLMEPEFENHMRTLVLKAELWTGGLLDAKFEPGKVRPPEHIVGSCSTALPGCHDFLQS